MGSESFEVSSDAFASLHALLFTQAPVVASHLAGQGSFDGFFEAILYYTILYYTIPYYTIIYYQMIYYNMLSYTILTILYLLYYTIL